MKDHDSDSRCIGKEPCPQCGSRDNLARYDDGHGWCFGCGYYEPGGDAAPVNPKRRERMTDMVTGAPSALPKRGITEETCRFWNYCIGEYKGKPVQIANFRDADGNAVAQKLRFPNKDFLVTGDLKKAGLYGEWLWRDKGRMLVITEGEIDALTVSQMQNNKWPVVSIPNGAQGAAKAIARRIEWVEGFEKVILFFDDDEPGRAAAAEVAAMLTPGKAFIATVPGFKDANEALQAGEGARIIDAIWGAKEWRPDGVVDVDALIDEAAKPVELGIPWPWPSLTEKTYGIRPKELYAFGGGTGVGKSDLFKDVALHLVGLGHKVGLIFLEEPPAHTLKMLAGKSAGKRFHVPGVQYDAAELRAAVDKLRGKVFLFNHFGAMDYETIKSKIKYMVTALDCRHIFLDHLTALAAAIEDQDERKAIDFVMADLAALAQQLNFTLYFVSHLTTPDGTAHEEGGRVLEKHFRGSRSIAFWSHFMFGIERNKQEPDGVTTFRVLKDRYTGDSAGHTFGLRYDRTVGRSFECDLPAGSGHGFKDEGDGEF
jgi:twinkle protein